MHIRRKIGVIATHIDMCAIFQPIEHLTAAFPHALLNIDFFRAIARESDIHPVKHPVLQPGLPFALIQEISAEIAFAEEKPAFPACPAHFPLLQEGPVRRDPSARANHADWSILGWQSEMPVALDVNRQDREHTSELQSLMRISYAVFCLNKKKTPT